jgi:cold shock CspA family protein
LVPLCDEHFNDECFDDNRRRTVWNRGWKNKEEFNEFCRTLWTLDYWQNQPHHVEVWLEKDTASFLVQGVTDRLRVPLRVSAGNFSRTFLHNIARDMSSTLVPIKILYIGDFDPSGVDIEWAAKRGETKEDWIARRIREGKTDKQSHQPKDGLADHLEKHFGWESEPRKKQPRPQQSSSKVSAKRRRSKYMQGIVRWYSAQGFGFIDDPSGSTNGEAYYFHVTAVRNRAILKPGDSVIFDAAQGPRGLKAVNVRVLDTKEAIKCPQTI